MLQELNILLLCLKAALVATMLPGSMQGAGYDFKDLHGMGPDYLRDLSHQVW